MSEDSLDLSEYPIGSAEEKIDSINAYIKLNFPN